MTPWRGDTRVRGINSDSDSDSDEQKMSPGFEKKREEETRDDTAELATKKIKRSPGFSGKNRGVTPSVAAPGVTHPSDATGICLIEQYLLKISNRCCVVLLSKLSDLPLELLEMVLMRTFLMVYSSDIEVGQPGMCTRSESRAFALLSSVCWNWRQTMSGWPQSPTGQWLRHQLKKLIERECIYSVSLLLFEVRITSLPVQ